MTACGWCRDPYCNGEHPDSSLSEDTWPSSGPGNASSLAAKETDQ